MNSRNCGREKGKSRPDWCLILVEFCGRRTVWSPAFTRSGVWILAERAADRINAELRLRLRQRVSVVECARRCAAFLMHNGSRIYRLPTFLSSSSLCGKAASPKGIEARPPKANAYLEKHPRAKASTQERHLTARLNSLKVADWLQLSIKARGLVLTLDTPALEAAAQLDGCYVVETDLPAPQADAQTIHDRYKDLAYVERDFRTLKTGHLEIGRAHV
jgi:hypothetical protein